MQLEKERLSVESLLDEIKQARELLKTFSLQKQGKNEEKY